VVDSVEGWLPDNAEATVAILVPINERGAQITKALQNRGLPYLEMLRSTSVTRQTAGALGNLLRCLADPTSARKLSVAFQVWRREGKQDPESQALTKQVGRRIAGCPAVEAYLWPRADHDWLAPLVPELPGEEYAPLVDFRQMARRWHRAAVLPIDQLILTLAGDLFQEPAELALAHKLAGLLRDASAAHPGYRLPELVEELAVIARNERRFLGFSADDTGFEPPKGKVTVTTMHKAKGLEWDRVYLTSVNNYDFPSGQAHDTYISERWFVRDGLNLEAEALAQLGVLAQGPGTRYVEGAATQEARWDYVAERLRLFYVGITRARRDLLVTWNTGRGRMKRQQAAPFAALEDYWERAMDQDLESD
jgi:DNA helicase-2/ATP-dependent DNA helicase PcrA